MHLQGGAGLCGAAPADGPVRASGAHGGSSIRLGYRSEAVVAGCVGPFNRHILVKPLVDHG
jgi:hypothetical protein